MKSIYKLFILLLASPTCLWAQTAKDHTAWCFQSDTKNRLIDQPLDRGNCGWLLTGGGAAAYFSGNQQLAASLLNSRQNQWAAQASKLSCMRGNPLNEQFAVRLIQACQCHNPGAQRSIETNQTEVLEVLREKGGCSSTKQLPPPPPAAPPALQPNDFASPQPLPVSEFSVLNRFRPKAKCQEFNLKNIGEWNQILKVKTGTAIKLEAVTSENNYIQPWVIYVWKAHEQQNAALSIIPMQQLHEHSSAAEWQVEPNGVLKVRKTKYDTARLLGISSLELLRGPGADVYLSGCH